MGKPKDIKEHVLKLRSIGTSYNEIARVLGCSKATVAYHCGEGQKEKCKKRGQKNRLTKVIGQKVYNFQKERPVAQKKEKYSCDDAKLWRDKVNDFQRERLKRGLGKHIGRTFDRDDVVGRFGINTICYLTGRPINLLEPKTYQFDHIKPVSQGGNFSIDNLGIACREANQAKHKLTTKEFIQLCQEVLEHNGYKVTKI